MTYKPKMEVKGGVNQKDEVEDLVLDKLLLSEDNAKAGQVVDSEKVETESGTLTVKEMDSKKAKAGLRTCPEKVPNSEKVKARLGTLTEPKLPS